MDNPEMTVKEETAEAEAAEEAAEISEAVKEAGETVTGDAAAEAQ